jgi:hypothetical protein
MSSAQPHSAKRGLEINAALEALRGCAHYLKIAGMVARTRRARGERVAKNIAASIRNGLQRHCSTCPHYGGHTDLFRRLDRGVWCTISYWIKNHG